MSSNQTKIESRILLNLPRPLSHGVYSAWWNRVVCIFYVPRLLNAQCSFSVNAFTFIKVNDHRCLRFTPDTRTHSPNQQRTIIKLFGFNCITYHWANGFCGTKQHSPTKITDWMYTVHNICAYSVSCKSCATSVLFFLLLIRLAVAIVYVGSLSFTNVIATQKGTMKCKRS